MSAVATSISLKGVCNVCGNDTQFYSPGQSCRESLVCAKCKTTSRYRSIARGVLRAVHELTGVHAASLAELPEKANQHLRIYDTQLPFYYEPCSYPIPDLLRECGYDVQLSLHVPQYPWGQIIDKDMTNQNLEALTFRDASFDIVITSDVMEHVRLDYLAHKEIRRVLKPGGVYLFTVPHSREPRTLHRVTIVDPMDPSQDEFPVEKEYHNDTNSEDNQALCYRVYGSDLDAMLAEIGFTVDYCHQDFHQSGILDTELFYCRASLT